MANVPEHNITIKESFMRFLQVHNVESRVVVGGRPIDLWDLCHAVDEFDMSPGHSANGPSKFHLIATRLGIFNDTQTDQVASQQVKDLQEDYARVCTVIQNARNSVPRPPNLLPSKLAGPSPPRNALLLQILLRAFPFINLNTVTPDMLANMPYQQFEAKMRSYLSDLPWPIPDNRAMGNPPSYRVSNMQMLALPNTTLVLNLREIKSLHEDCQSLWRKVYDTLPRLISHLPNDIQLWEDRYRQAMVEMKPVVVGMGLYYYMQRDKKEIIHIMQTSALLMKQQQLLGTHIFLTIEGLEDIIRFFQPRRQRFELRIDRMRSLGILPPILHSLTNHAETDFATLGGLLPHANPTPFHPQVPEGRETAPPAAVPTPLDSSANASDNDLDADGESEVDELRDDEDLYADSDSELDEWMEDELAAAADASVGHQGSD